MSKWLYSMIFATAMGSLIADDIALENLSTQIASVQTPCVAETEPDFPYGNAHWFTKEAFLYWKPYVDDLDYANKFSTDFSTTNNIDMKIKNKKPNFHWFSGVRVALGRYLQNDDWDLTMTGTYYYADAKGKSSTILADGISLTPLWPSPQNLDTASKAHNLWSLNFFTADVSMGREYKIFSTIIAHPYLGVRGAFIYQKNRASYSGTFPLSTLQTQTNQEQFRSKSDVWGVGPRVGTDFVFKFAHHWALIGNFAGSILVGKYENKIKLHDVFITSGSSVVGGSTLIQNFKFKDDGYTIRPCLEGSLGVSYEWETSIRHRDIHIEPSIVFEASEWFGVNQTPRLSGFLSGFAKGSTVNYFRQHGDLGFLGCTFNLQVDF